VVNSVASPLYPNFHDIHMSKVRILDGSNVKLQGFAANTGGFTVPQHPLTMTLTDVVADRPGQIAVISSDAILTLRGVNLPVFSSTEDRVAVWEDPTQAVDPSQVVDCSRAFVDFPSSTSPDGKTW
jgi:hypothetical protein